jgi:2',3'-cyclic-nucleotide 2'-phosphodiesterase/3'-nucleotidase
MKRIFKIYPYENNVCIMSMMGEDIRRYLEASVNEQYEQYKNGDTPLLRVKKDRYGHILYTEDSKTYLLSSPDNFFAAGGIKYTIDLTKPEGSRVNIISKTDGTPFELRNTYNVAINSYVARGGDNTFVNWLGWNDETIRIHATQSRPVSIRQYMREYIISHKDTLKISDDSNWHIEPYAWWKNQKELEKQRQDFVWTATYKAIRSREANPHYKK